MQLLVITPESSREAQDRLQKRLTLWLHDLLEYPGYKEFKNEQLRGTLLAGLLPGEPSYHLSDFRFSPEIEKHHPLVAGYYELLTTIISVRECEYYFRKYPFRNKNVSREAHLRTCCELFLSRIFQFRERWLAHLTRLDRRTNPKGLPLKALRDEFENRFSSILEARHKIHHEEAYDDIELKALGVGDLLSYGDDHFGWLRVSQGRYRQIRNDWVRRVREAAQQLDLFVGVTASLMLERCQFLPIEEERDLHR